MAMASRLGAESQSLHTGVVAPQGRLILPSDELERLFGVDPWSGPAVMEIRSTSNFRVMTRLTSPSGLISNTNCVTTNQVDNVVGFDSSDVTYIRFINTEMNQLLILLVPCTTNLEILSVLRTAC